jgi:hypothetical protein
VTFQQPGLEVARVFREELVAEVIGEPPTTLAECAQYLGSEGGDQGVVPGGLVFPPHHLSQDSGYHV